MDEHTKSSTPAFDFKSLLKNKPKISRELQRIEAHGVALIFDTNGELISKAKLVNLSTSGMGFEVESADYRVETVVQVVLAGKGRSLGIIDCIVRWVEVTAKDPVGQVKSREIGLQVSKHDPKIAKAFEAFVKDATPGTKKAS